MDFFMQAKKGNNQIWIWLVTLLVVCYPFYQKIFAFLTEVSTPKKTKQILKDSDTVNNLLSSVSLKALVFFAILLISLKFFHNRKIRTLFTGREKFDWLRFFTGIFVWGVAIIIGFSIGYYYNSDIVRYNFRLMPFLKLFFICISLVTLRAVFIEVLFRGYILQGVFLITNNKLGAVIASAIFYMLVFSTSILIDEVGYELLLFNFAVGIVLGIIVVFDEGLELSISFQIVNTMVALLYISTNVQGYQTDAIFFDDSKPKVLFLVYIPVFVLYPLVVLCFKKIYKWNNLKARLLNES